MVDLPSIPSRMPTVSAPQSRVSAADIASPYEQLSHSLDKAGATLEDIAAREAQDQGSQAVSIGPDGKPQVTQRPLLFGKAADAYDRAVRVAAMTQAETVADRDLLTMREEHRADPSSFVKAADAYRAEKVNQYSKAAGPQMRLALDKAISSRANGIYNGIVSEKQHLDLERSGDAINSRLSTLSDDMEVLARNGGTNSDTFRQRASDFNALLEEKVKNPLFHYSAEHADRYRDDVMTRAHGAAVLDQVDNIYRKDGYDAARRYLVDTTDKLGATLKQSDRIRSEGLKWLRAEEMGQKGERDALGRDWTAMKTLGANVPRDSMVQLREQARAAGNHRVVDDINDHMAAFDIASTLRNLPPAERAVAVASGSTTANVRSAMNFFRQRGYSQAQASGIVGNLLQESATLNPSESHDAGSGVGVAGWRMERRDALRRFAAERGTNETDFHTQLEFIDRELKTSESFAGGELGRSRTPEEAARAMLHFERPQGYSRENPEAGHGYLNRVRNAQMLSRTGAEGEEPPKEGAKEGEGKDTPQQGATDLTRSRAGLLALNIMRKEMGHELGRQITDLKSAVAKQELPALDEVMTLGSKVAAVGTDEQRQDFAEIAAIAQYGDQFRKLSASERSAVISSWNERLKGEAPAYERRLRDAVVKADHAISEEYKHDPYDAFYRYSSSPEAKALPPLNLGNAREAQDLMSLKVRQQNIIRAEQGIGAFSVLRPAEVDQFKAALDATNDPRAKMALYGLFNRLPDDIRAATFGKLGQHGPDAMVGAYAGALGPSAPAVAESILRGQQAMKTDPRYAKHDEDDFKQALDKHLPGTVFTIEGATNPNGAYATMRDAVFARYADLSAQAGDVSGKVIDKRLQQAVTDVTGGVLDWNGGKIIAPKRGMAQDELDSTMWNLTDADLMGKGVGTLAGEPLSARYLYQNGKLESAGDGTYFVRLNADPLRPTYAYKFDESGIPTKFELDLRDRQPGAPAPGAFTGTGKLELMYRDLSGMVDSIGEGARHSIDYLGGLGRQISDALVPEAEAAPRITRGRSAGGRFAAPWSTERLGTFREMIDANKPTAEIVKKTGVSEEMVDRRITANQIAQASVGDSPSENPLVRLYLTRTGPGRMQLHSPGDDPMKQGFSFVPGPTIEQGSKIDKQDFIKFTESLSAYDLNEVSRQLPRETYARYIMRVIERNKMDNGEAGDSLLRELHPEMFSMQPAPVVPPSGPSDAVQRAYKQFLAGRKAEDIPVEEQPEWFKRIQAWKAWRKEEFPAEPKPEPESDVPLWRKLLPSDWLKKK